jgi:hypothetical protein
LSLKRALQAEPSVPIVSANHNNVQTSSNNSNSHQQQQQLQFQQPTQKIVVGKQQNQNNSNNQNISNNLAQSSIDSTNNSNNSSGNYQSGSYHIDNSGLKQVVKPLVKSSITPAVGNNQPSQISNSINTISNSNNNNNSSLPPIMGHGNFTSGTAQSNNSMGSSQNLVATKTKKKKYRILYGQRAVQNTEQVMKAYGVVGGHPTPHVNNASTGGVKLQSLNI